MNDQNSLAFGFLKNINLGSVWKIALVSTKMVPSELAETTNVFHFGRKAKLLSRVWFFETPWTVAHQAPLYMGFSRQEYWSGLPFLLQGIFLIQWLNLGLLHCRRILYYLSHKGNPCMSENLVKGQTSAQCTLMPFPGPFNSFAAAVVSASPSREGSEGRACRAGRPPGIHLGFPFLLCHAILTD